MLQKNFALWQENFDAAEELRALAKNNDAATSENEKKKARTARTVFSAGTKIVEKYKAGHGNRSLAKPKFLFGQ